MAHDWDDGDIMAVCCYWLPLIDYHTPGPLLNTQVVIIPTKRYDYPHFTDRKTEVQRVQVIVHCYLASK